MLDDLAATRSLGMEGNDEFWMKQEEYLRDVVRRKLHEAVAEAKHK